MPKNKILVVDDHALVREGIIALLKIYDDVEVIGEASDGLEAIEKVKKINPDIILMDISMPKLGGFEAVTEIKNGEIVQFERFGFIRIENKKGEITGFFTHK